MVVLTACGGGTQTSPSTIKKARFVDLSKAIGIPGRVERVNDGDTVVLRNGDRIRLVQIDAPEAEGECYGQKAETVLARLLPVGAHIRISRDSKLDNIDRYGRKLRYIFKGKQNINLALVRRGAASVWFFNGGRGRYAYDLLGAARAARASDRGAWGACEATLNPIRAFATHPRTKTPAPPPRPAIAAPPQQPAVTAPPPQPANTPTAPQTNCNANYSGCLNPNAADYDCAGGSGDGPYYTGTVQVLGYDEYGLDSDGDGWGCE